MFQIQATLDQREQERLFAQETINENYCVLASTLENIYNRIVEPKQPLDTWDYYDPQQSGKLKDLESLFDEAYSQIFLFSVHHRRSYTERFRKYDFAKNFAKEEVMQHLNILSSCKELKPLLHAIIHIYNQEYDKVEILLKRCKRKKKPWAHSRKPL